MNAAGNFQPGLQLVRLLLSILELGRRTDHRHIQSGGSGLQAAVQHERHVRSECKAYLPGSSRTHFSIDHGLLHWNSFQMLADAALIALVAVFATLWVLEVVDWLRRASAAAYRGLLLRKRVAPSDLRQEGFNATAVPSSMSFVGSDSASRGPRASESNWNRAVLKPSQASPIHGSHFLPGESAQNQPAAESGAASQDPVALWRKSKLAGRVGDLLPSLHLSVLSKRQNGPQPFGAAAIGSPRTAAEIESQRTIKLSDAVIEEAAASSQQPVAEATSNSTRSYADLAWPNLTAPSYPSAGAISIGGLRQAGNDLVPPQSSSPITDAIPETNPLDMVERFTSVDSRTHIHDDSPHTDAEEEDEQSSDENDDNFQNSAVSGGRAGTWKQSLADAR